MMKKCQPRSLTPFLDGELTEDAWHELDEHLHTCPTCTAELDELTAASQQVRAMGRSEIPRDALRSALDVISGRAGLSPAAMLTETTEIARAGGSSGAELEPQMEPELAAGTPAEVLEIELAEPPVGDGADQAWTPGPALSSQLPEIEIPDDVYWNQPRAGMPSETAAADGRAGQETEMEPAPTWVDPERWHPSGPSVPDGPAFMPPPQPIEGVAPSAPGAEAADEEAIEAEDLPLGAAVLETHPSPPPAGIVPSWMGGATTSDAELEKAGREAIDDAIGPAPEAIFDVGPRSLPPTNGAEGGPTSAAEAALRADREADTEDPDQAAVPRRSWFTAIFRGDAQPTAGEPTEDVAQGAEATTVAPGDPEPVADRPEAERLMWITPRTPSIPPEHEPSIEAEAPALAPPNDEPDVPDFSHLRGYREALLWARAAPGEARSKLLSSPQFRIRVGLGAALLLIMLAAAVLYSTRSAHPSPTAVAKPATGQAAAPTPKSQASPSSLPSPASSPVTSPAGGQLTAVVSSGGGGSGWTVARIRIGSPGNGITRVVLDLDGSGATPSAKLGRGSDGAIYLMVPGLSISPAVIAGVAPTGVVTAIAQADGTGTSLKFSTSGNPGFSLGYLTTPNRLVLDFK